MIGRWECVMASPAHLTKDGGSSTRSSPRNLGRSGMEEVEVGFSARLGGLILTEKEAAGLVAEGSDPILPQNPRWVALGKVCAPRKFNISVLDRAMHSAWGLHGSAKFRDLG